MENRDDEKEYPTDHKHLLENIRKSYTDTEDHEVMLLENFDNTIDSRTDRVDITIRDGDFEIEDYGKGMTEDEMGNFLSLAQAKKDITKNIGFAGVGAKIYLQYIDPGKKLVIETRSDKHRGISESYFKGNQLYFKILDKQKLTLNHNGTKSITPLNDNDKQKLTPNMATKIIQDNYPTILMGHHNIKTVKVNGEKIRIIEMNIVKESSMLNFKLNIDGSEKKFSCIFYLNNKDVPEEEQNPGIVVFGKLIKREPFINREHIKFEFRERITGFVFADGLSAFLATNKKDFNKKRDTPWKKFSNEVYNLYIKWLKKIGAYQEREKARTSTFRSAVISSLVEEFIEKLNNDPFLKKYDPWVRKSKQDVMAKDSTGSFNITDIENTQITEGTFGGQNKGDGIKIDGPEDGKGVTESSDGKEKGKEIPRMKKTGIKIGYDEKEEDPHEFWNEPDQITLNTGHPTFVRYDNPGLFRDSQANSRRVIGMALVAKYYTDDFPDSKDKLDELFLAISKFCVMPDKKNRG